MSWKLFVDDDRVGPQHEPGWVFAPNYEKALELIAEKGLPDEVSLDHDIWTGCWQGDDFCAWLVRQDLPTEFEYRVHSSNKEGAENMIAILSARTGKLPRTTRQWW